MANKESTKGGFSKVIKTIRKEANQAVENLKKDVIDTVRSEMDGITVDVGTIDVDVDAKINGNLRKRLSDQIKKQIPEKIQQELEIELTPKFAGKIQKINLDNMIQMNSKELKKKIDEYYDSAVEGSETGSKRFVAAMKIAKFRGIELDDDVFDDYEYAFEQFEKGAKGYAEKLDNILKGIDFSLISKSAQKSSDYIIEAFKGIIRESKSVGSVEKFLNGIRDGSIEATDKVKGLLSITQVLSNGKYSFSAIDEGTRHSDGFVSDEYTVIARESKYEEKTDTLIPKLQQAEKAGVRLGTVIGTIKDDANGLFYEIQKTQKGKIINEDNLEFLEATDEEILKFKKDLQTLQKLGLYVDTGGQNIMYQKGLGFSFIDLAMPKKGERVPDYLKNDFEGIAEAFEEYLPYNGETFKLTPESQSALDNFKREISETADVVETQIKRMGDSVDKYNGIISRMKKPGFHVGNMETDESYISDNFQSNQSLDRMGSGSFWMTDIDEALTLLEEKTEAGEKVKLYITDLGNALDNMTHITSVDEYDEYTQFLGTFNKFVMAIATEGEESSEYMKKLNSQGITDLDSLYKNYELYFDEFGITKDKLNEIVKDSVKYAKESIKSGDMVDDLSAYLQSKYMGLKGVTTKDVADLDNYGVGTVVFHKEDLGDIFAVDSKDQLSLDTVKNIFKQALLEKAQNDENTINEFNYLLNKYEDSPVLKQLYSDGELSSIISEMKKVHTEAQAQAELNKQKSAEPTSNETLVSTESTNADTKAFLSKKDAVERLRTELNLTKKAAEDLFDQQGYIKSSKGQYEIEKEAVDELINSYEELQKVEGASNTIPSTDIGEIKEETKANLDLVDSMDKVDKEKEDDKTNQVTEQSAKLTAEEAQAMADLFDKALKAAEAKEKFAGANKQVLESIITSLSALNSEGDGFNNLNKIINNLANNKDDRITNLVKNLTSIRDILSTSINEDAFVNALRDIANQGENLKDLATVLKATQSQINKAKQSIKSQSSTNPVSPVQSDQKDVRGTSHNQQYDSQGNVTREVSSFTVRNQSGRNTRYTRTTNSQTGEIQYAIHETTDYNKAIDDTVTAIIRARKVQHDLNLEWEKTKPNQDRINALTDELSDYYRVIRQATQAAHDFEQENADWYNDTATGSKYGQQQHFTDYVRQRVTQGIAKEDERYASYISKRNEKLIRQVDNDIFTAQFELDNGDHTEAFNDKLRDIITNLETIKKTRPDTITERQVELAREYSDELKKANKEGKLSANNKANENSILKNLGQINELLSGNTKLSFRNTDVYRDLINLQNEFKNFNTSRPQSELKDLTTRFLEVKSRFNELSETFKGDNLFITFIKRLHSTTAQLIAQYFSFQDIIRYVRSMATTIIDLDTQLVDLRKTTTMTTTELERFYNSSSEVAKQLGVTTSEIISQASAWSRLGYSSQEAATKMAKLSSQFASISPGMDTESATDALVSTMQAYKIGVEDVQRTVMDNINAIGNTMATTNSEIGEMLQRSSAAMKAANNTLEETIALESAAVEITRNAETTGTAFRTISMRIRGKQSLPPYSESYMLCA